MWEGNCRPGGAGSFSDPYTKPSFARLQQGKVSMRGKGRPEVLQSPILHFPFSPDLLTPSTAACTCLKYHPSQEKHGQLRETAEISLAGSG